MPTTINTQGVHHLAIRSTNLSRAKSFYLDTLGFNSILEVDNLFIFLAGSTAVGVRGPEEQSDPGDSFDPYRVGLDHIALSCDNEDDLHQLASYLDAQEVWNTGVKTDPTLGKLYLAFKDPDGIKWEYYMV